MNVNCSITKIPCSLTKFFKYWLQFTVPLHKLLPKDIEILACILKKRYELSLIITEEHTIDMFLFTKEVKEQILKELGMEQGNGYNQTLSKFRKLGIIMEGNKLNKRFIPNISRDGSKFNLMIVFDINNDLKQTHTNSSKQSS
jgi:hypothetical protein